MRTISKNTVLLLLAVFFILSYMSLIPWLISGIAAALVVLIFYYLRNLQDRPFFLFFKKKSNLRKFFPKVKVKVKNERIYRLFINISLLLFLFSSLLPLSNFFLDDPIYFYFIIFYSFTITLIGFFYINVLNNFKKASSLFGLNLLFTLLNLIFIISFYIKDGAPFAILLFIWVLISTILFVLNSILASNYSEVEREKGNSNSLYSKILVILYPLFILLLIYYLIYLDGLYMLMNVLLFGYILIKNFKRINITSLFKESSKIIRTLTIAVASISLFLIIIYQQSGKVMSILFLIVTLSVVASGLNLVVGFTGLLDLGYIAFFGMGAYISAIFSSAHTNTVHVALPIIVALALAALSSGVFGGLVGTPTLLIKGDFLAIITLGFGEVFRIAVNNLDNFNGHNITNGPNGIFDIPPIKIFHYSFDNALRLPVFGEIPGDKLLLFCLFGFLGLSLLIVRNLKKSLFGKALFAIKQDEVIALSMGINSFLAKVSVFILGAAFAGLFGGIYAHVIKTISPEQFQFVDSVNLLVAVIVGGSGLILGPVVGEFIVTTVPEKLRFLDDYRLLIFAVLLMFVIKLMPNGVLGRIKKQ